MFNVSFQDSKQNWEEYEAGKKKTAEFLKRANNELTRTPANAGQEAVQKELSKKREMHQGLQELQPEVDYLEKVTEKLRLRASEPRQDGLQQDLSELQDSLADTTQSMASKVNVCVV